MDISAQLIAATTSLSEEVAMRVGAQEQAVKNFKELTAARLEIGEISAQLDAANAELAGAKSENVTLLANAETAKAVLAEAVKVTAERVNAQVSIVLAATGHAPLKIGQGDIGDSSSSKTMTRGEFDRLPADQRSAAMRAKIRLTD